MATTSTINVEHPPHSRTGKWISSLTGNRWCCCYLYIPSSSRAPSLVSLQFIIEVFGNFVCCDHDLWAIPTRPQLEVIFLHLFLFFYSLSSCCCLSSCCFHLVLFPHLAGKRQKTYEQISILRREGQSSSVRVFGWIGFHCSCRGSCSCNSRPSIIIAIDSGSEAHQSLVTAPRAAVIITIVSDTLNLWISFRALCCSLAPMKFCLESRNNKSATRTLEVDFCHPNPELIQVNCYLK